MTDKEFEEELLKLADSPESKALEISLQKLSDSKGATKIKNYFLDLVDRDDFQRDIKSFREKYQIPKNGFEETERDSIYPDLPPKSWGYDFGNDDKAYITFLNEVGLLGEKYKIPVQNYSMVDEYIMYNKVDFSNLGGLCLVQDSLELGKHKDTDRENNEAYPILLRVSPYASLRDILDYIQIAYTPLIKPLQEIYQDKEVKLGKSRSKSEILRKRNAFIFKHRHLPLREISILLRGRKDLGADRPDEGNIGKIISLEKKKRKEV